MHAFIYASDLRVFAFLSFFRLLRERCGAACRTPIDVRKRSGFRGERAEIPLARIIFRKPGKRVVRDDRRETAKWEPGRGSQREVKRHDGERKTAGAKDDGEDEGEDPPLSHRSWR